MPRAHGRQAEAMYACPRSGGIAEMDFCLEMLSCSQKVTRHHLEPSDLSVDGPSSQKKREKEKGLWDIIYISVGTVLLILIN